MNRLEEVRAEFLDQQHLNKLQESRFHSVQVVKPGTVPAGGLPEGFNGVSSFRRDDDTIICECAYANGTVDGCTRYYSRDGELVGEEYYEEGSLRETRIFSRHAPESHWAVSWDDFKSPFA